MQLGVLQVIISAMEAAMLAQSDIRSQLSGALRDACGPDQYPWLAAVIGDAETGDIVYELGGKFWQCGYSITATSKGRSTVLQMSSAYEVMPRVSYDKALGTAVESKRDLTEASEFCDGLPEVRFTESDSYTIKVIAPGQGSSAFYPAEVLKSQGPKVFKAGTKMYWNHPTKAEEASRPEGDLDKLAGVLTGNAYWDEAGKKGPGLYAPIRVFADYAAAVESKAPEIGVSIRAYGIGETGKDGKYTLKQFTHAESIDFVTEPGAGGRILTESAKKENEMELTEARIKELIGIGVAEATAPLTVKISTLESENAGLRILAAGGVARTFLADKLKTEKLPEASKLRVVDSLLAALPMKEGKLDEEKLNEAYLAAVKYEAAFAASILGTGNVRGMNSVPVAESEGKEPTDEEFHKSMVESAKRNGMNDEQAQVWAKGRQ